MSNYNSDYEIAEAISERIGSEPIPFDSVYEISLQIYNELGGEPERFDSVYEILLGILPLIEGGIASKVIDDHSIATDKTWSSNKLSNMFANIPQLEAGQNISVENGKINALGYNFNGKGFAEIPLFRNDAIQELKNLDIVGLNDLQLTGAAGATTYTMGGTSAAVMMSEQGMYLVQMGAMMKTANSEIAKISSMNTTNSTITLESTLDANNALSNEVVTNLYLPVVIFISGAAGATTYTYTSDKIPSFSVGDTVSFGDYPLVKVISIDTSNKTITFDKTLDENAAVSNAQFNYSLKENTTASGLDSHAEGTNTIASGTESHAEGNSTKASGTASHAEGNSTKASGEFAHSEGYQTNAKNKSEHAEGHYNVSHKVSDTYGDAGNTQHVIGICTGIKSRKNAFEVMENGDMYVLGSGGYNGKNTKVQNASIKTLQEYITSLEARITALEGNSTV